MDQFYKQILELSDYKDCDGSVFKIDVSIENDCTGSNVSIESLTKGINSIVSAKKEFEDEDGTLLSSLFGLLGQPEFLCKISIFSNISFATDWKSSILTSIEEMEPSFKKKNEFENLDKSIPLAHLWVFRLSGS